MRFENLSWRRVALLALVRWVPYVNHRLPVYGLVAALGAVAGGAGIVLGAIPQVALPAGAVGAFALAALCNAVHYVAWGPIPRPPRPPGGPGDPSGDFEPRPPLVPAGTGAVEAPLPEPEEGISATYRPRTLRSRRRAR